MADDNAPSSSSLIMATVAGASTMISPNRSRYGRNRSKRMKIHKKSTVSRLLVLVMTVGVLLISSVPVTAMPSHHKSIHQISSTTTRTPKQLRGGASVKAAKLSSSSSSSVKQKNKAALPTVQAILIPRKVNLLRVVQGISLALLLVSLFRCIVTAGIPFGDAVWTALHAGVSAPINYQPSEWDIMLTRYSTLPPPFLPTAGPLVALLLSSIAFVGLGLLLPRWFASSYRVALEYQQLDASSNDERLLARKLVKQQLSSIGNDSMKKKLAVLVQVPRETRVYTEHNKALVVCPLQETTKKAKKKDTLLYFDLCNQRYYYDNASKKNDASVTSGAPTLQYETISTLLHSKSKGLTSKTKLTDATNQFDAYNHIELPTPTIRQAFGARLASPLVVLQLFGKVLSALEDSSLLHTLFGMSQTLTHHYWNARQSIVSARELAQEVHDHEANQMQVRVKRSSSSTKKWTTVNAMNVLPGDVFQMGAPSNSKGTKSKQQHVVVPVDAVILEGSAVTNEAVLTGETVAQSKVALEEQDDESGETLDMMGRHRSSILFAGTTILHTPTPLTCLALRTGSYSSRGDLLRALQKSRVGAVSNAQTERDGLRLMACLGAVACGSCTWFWHASSSDDVSVFRKILQCSRILLAAIPSDLPLALSAIAQMSAMKLKREADVVCSEPGSLLTASTVTHVLFDKTGTLTADTQSLSHNIVVNGTNHEEAAAVELVLAGCHSLVELQQELVGDPLDLASLRYSKWALQKDGSFQNNDGTTLWQIKTFPFDANRKTSSSLVLVQTADNDDSRLYKLIKGSPDVVQGLVSIDADYFGDTMTQLGEEGYRVIAMGIQDVTNDTELVGTIFPTGLPTIANNATSTKSTIKKAKKVAQKKLHRDAMEASGFDFCGFSCFEAVVRPSTPRIIKELQQAKMGVTMLTGDGVDAAVSVARRCQLISNTSEVAVLDWIDSKLSWKRLGETSDSVDEKQLSTRNIFAKNVESYALVATGAVVEALAGKEDLSREEKLIQSKLHTFGVFARASPSQKVLVASTFKQNDRKVLMCGDGVNDVAAMKVADCGVALLNGFGDQSTSDHDLEDDRRRQSVREKRIGSNRRLRRVSVGNPSLSKSSRVNRAKVKVKIDKALLEIRKRAADRQGIADPKDRALSLTTVELKETFAAISKINKEERQRVKLLNKGGAGAAKILADNDKQLNGEDEQGMPTDEDIKPGEASLVSPFSCLRPAIDGVEAILRYSVAASSFMQVMHQSIALNCLTSAFNLATLYRGGFRYGKHMWNVELPLYMLTEQASTQASCTPRPRLAISRPPVSLFNPFSVMTVLVQFFIHAMTRTTGVRIAKRLEAAFVEPDELRRMINVVDASLNGDVEKKTMVQLVMESLLEAPVEREEASPLPAMFKLFQRAPFKPNYVTNVIFLQSIFQSGLSTWVSHGGRPFHGAILEHRILIVGIALSILFSLSTLAEGFPKINEILELRPLPTASAQVCLVSVFFINMVACLIASTICNVGRGISKEVPNTDFEGKFEDADASAASQEEKLLFEETEENGSLVRIMVAATGMVFLSSMAKSLEAEQKNGF